MIGDVMQVEISVGIAAVFDQFRRDRFGGAGWLGGSMPAGDDDGRAKVMNTPSRVQITVLEPITHEVVARTVSRPDGTWSIWYLDPLRRFTVIGSDWNISVNSAIQDWVQPAPIEP